MLEREGVGAVDFQGVSAQRTEDPVTLAGIINGVELSDQERRAVLAADALSVPLDVKGVLVGADIYLRSGVFRVGEVLGFEPDQAVGARDTVRTDPGYEPLWAQFNLLKEPGIAAVALYKRAGKTLAETAVELGMEPRVVEGISKRLVDFGINRIRTSQQRRLEELCREVEEADRNTPGTLLTAKELALALNTSPSRIETARIRNRNLGRVSTPGKIGVLAQGNVIRSAILSNPKFTDRQVLEVLTREGMKGLTGMMITHRRHELIQEGRVQPKVRPGREGDRNKKVVLSTTEEAEQALRIALPEILASGEPLVLSNLRSRIPALSRVSKVALYNIYHRLEKEGYPVPPFKFSRTRRTR